MAEYHAAARSEKERCNELSERVERGDSERVRIEGEAKQERQVLSGPT